MKQKKQRGSCLSEADLPFRVSFFCQGQDQRKLHLLMERKYLMQKEEIEMISLCSFCRIKENNTE